MDYFKTIQFSKIITTIVDKANINKPEQQNHRRIFKTAIVSDDQITPSFETSLAFINNIRQRVEQIIENQKQKKQKTLLQKKSIFYDLNIEPIYMHTDENYQRIIQFQFQLGTSTFLQRITLLFDELSSVQKAIQNVISRSESIKLSESLNIVQNFYDKVQSICVNLAKCRSYVKSGKFYKNNIEEKLKLKTIISKKLRYIKQLKGYWVQSKIKCENLQQIFYTQKQRNELYHKVVKNQELLFKICCLKNIKGIHINNAKDNVQIIKSYLEKWLSKNLTNKQIQKLLIVIYYMKTKPIYHENDIQIDFRKFNQDLLKVQIQKVKKWSQYTYLNETKAQSKVIQFLSILITEIHQFPLQ